MHIYCVLIEMLLSNLSFVPLIHHLSNFFSFAPHPALQDNVWKSLCLGSSDIFSIMLWKYPTSAGLCKKTVSPPFCVDGQPLMCPLEFHEALWIDVKWTNYACINRCPLLSRSWRRSEVQNQWNLSSSFNSMWHMNIRKESGRKGFAKWLSSALGSVSRFLKLKGWRMSRESYNPRVQHVNQQFCFGVRVLHPYSIL